MASLREFLCQGQREKRPFLLDGSMKTALDELGFVTVSESYKAPLFTSGANFTTEGLDLVEKAHEGFVYAGASIISTNTYQASLLRMAQLGLPPDSILKAVARAAAVRDRWRAEDRQIFVAGSIGPFGVTMENDSEYTGDYGSESGLEDKVYSYFRDQSEHLSRGDVDCLLFETLPTEMDVVAVDRLTRSGDYCGLDAIVSLSCRDEESLRTGYSIRDIAKMLIDNPKIVAIGVNCGVVANVTRQIGLIASEEGWRKAEKSIVVYPNFDHWGATEGRIDEHRDCLEWVAAGAIGIGGCCGTSANLLKEMGELISAHGHGERQ